MARPRAIRTAAPRAAATAARPADGVERRHALVVGVGEHPDPEMRLPYAADDARRVAAVLRARGFRVTALHDGLGRAGEPTRAKVTAAIARVARAADADDLVVAYLCCHGARVDERPYLYLRDTPRGTAALATRGLPLATLLEGLRGGPRWTGIFLDVCAMGLGLDPDTAASVDDAGERAGGFALLAASTSTAISQDATDGGIFTRHLVSGLAGAAADADGGLRFSALARHIQGGVARWRDTKEGQLKGSKQRPVLRLEAADLHLLAPTVQVALAPAVASAMTCAAFSPDGRVVATGHEDHGVRLWDAARGTAIGAAMTHEASIAGLAFVDGGRALETVGTDGSVRRWRVRDRRPLASSPAPLGGDVAAVAWSPDGSRLVAALTETEIPGITDGDPARLVDRLDAARALADVRITRRLVTREGRAARALGELAELPMAVACADGARGSFVAFADGVLARRDRRGTSKEVGRIGGPMAALAISPGGERIAGGGMDVRAGGLARGQAAIWPIAGGEALELAAHPARVNAIAWSPDGTAVLTACGDGLARVWDAATGQLLRELARHAQGVVVHVEAVALACASKGRRILVGYADGEGRVFELEARR